MSFGSPSYSSPDTPADRRARFERAASQGRARIRGMSDDAKVTVLSLAIETAIVSRGSVSLLDLTQAGFTESEAAQHYEAAMAKARAKNQKLFAQAS